MAVILPYRETIQRRKKTLRGETGGGNDKPIRLTADPSCHARAYGDETFGLGQMDLRFIILTPDIGDALHHQTKETNES